MWAVEPPPAGTEPNTAGKPDAGGDRENITAADPAVTSEELKETQQQQKKTCNQPQHTITWLKMELKLRCQPISGKEHVLVGNLDSAMNKNLPWYSTVEETKKSRYCILEATL